MCRFFRLIFTSLFCLTGLFYYTSFATTCREYLSDLFSSDSNHSVLEKFHSRTTDIFYMYGQDVTVSFRQSPPRSRSSDSVKFSEFSKFDAAKAERLAERRSMEPFSDLKTLGSILPEHFPLSKTEKEGAILYVMGGADSSKPILLFPNASLYIVATDLRFENVRKVKVGKDLEVRPKDIFEYVHWREVASDHQKINTILSGIMATDPSIRIISIEVLKSITDPERTHGLIRFDRGVGTEIQSYLHLDCYLTGERSDPTILNQLSIQAIIVSASNRAILENPKVYRKLLKLAQKSGSLIFEGQSGFTERGTSEAATLARQGHNFEFSGLREVLPNQTRSVVFYPIAWGYGDSVKVTKLSQDPAL